MFNFDICRYCCLRLVSYTFKKIHNKNSRSLIFNKNINFYHSFLACNFVSTYIVLPFHCMVSKTYLSFCRNYLYYLENLKHKSRYFRTFRFMFVSIYYHYAQNVLLSSFYNVIVSYYFAY